MKNQLIPYNIAIQLKELKCYERSTHYYENGKLKMYSITNDGWNFNQSFVECCSALTVDQVLEWFESEHDLYSEILIDKTLEAKYTYEVSELIQTKKELQWLDPINSEYLYRKKNEAKLECIKYLINYIKYEK